MTLPSSRPLRVAADGRYFTEADGRPFFWLGDTQWNLFRGHDADEAEAILADRAGRGFTAVQVMLMGFGKDKGFPSAGCEAFPDDDVMRPCEEYFRRVDAVVDVADRLGLVLVIGLDHPAMGLADERTGRAYGRWVGERYREHPRIIWVPSYAIPDDEFLPTMRQIVAGLREQVDGASLFTSHPDPALPTISSSVAHAEEWMSFHCIQTFASTHLVYDCVQHDYRLRPPKPVVLAEGAYEAGTEYGFEVIPWFVRRQAYWSYLAGGHHSYGHNDAWRLLPTWRQALDAPGARQMTVLRSVFTSRPWWELVPDQTLLADGEGAGNERNVAARSDAGTWCMAYLSTPCRVALRTSALVGSDPLRATWTDPRNGALLDGGELPRAGACAVSTPAGWEDAVLLVEE